MNYLEIIIPVKNEQANIKSLLARLDRALRDANIFYKAIFVDDHSTDNTSKLIDKLRKKYPIEYYLKKGKPGKAYSILEGFGYASAENLVMIDADLQYPPEAIPGLYKKLATNGVVIGKRIYPTRSGVRKLISKSFKFIFGKIVFGLNFDIQSGLKLFKREIISNIKETDVTAWTIDMQLIYTAIQLGYTIDEVEVEFSGRVRGKSSINLFKSSFEIGSEALKLKLSGKKVYQIQPIEQSSMLGAGVTYNQKKFITHTTLNHKTSALKTLYTWQKTGILIIGLILATGAFINWLLTIQLFVGVLSAVYFIDVLFNFFLIFRSLHYPPEIVIPEQAVRKLSDENLPTYSILCPLYKEAAVLPSFLESLSRINWPKNKLDVLLLLEEDDQETIKAVSNLQLPNYVRTIMVPDSNPKTKPKACNFGLHFALGEYLVVFDAEDQPEPDQLKKAYLAFSKLGSGVTCLQAKLNYHNPNQNLLTRLFTAEYSLWFGVILTGLQSIETTIPLGGTSNHFRTKDLRELQGWDPFNVTEDCDLGIRLFQNGQRTAIIDSTTLEEANSNFGNWLRQRSRWIKGYMQTYLVHMRNPIGLAKKQGIHILIFQLVLGGKIAFIFINPLLWVMTISYFTLYSLFGPTIESFYPPAVFYMAVTSLVFGNFLFLYYYMIGLAKKEQWHLIKFVFLIPIYWLMVSIAGTIALYQLIFKPHYWEKTIHGLHLKEEGIEEFVQEVIPAILPFPQRIKLKFKELIGEKQLLVGGSILILSNFLTNILNFVFNAYLGRQLSFENYGELSLFISFLFIASIPLGALSVTVSHKVAYLFGKYTKEKAKGYLNQTLPFALISSVILSLFWLALTPFLTNFFHYDTFFPFVFFAPVWVIGLLSANYNGYLQGVLSFGKLGIISISEVLVKLAVGVLLVKSGLSDYIVLTIPVSMLVSLLVTWMVASKIKAESLESSESRFNKSFFTASIFSGISTISFLGVDIILAKHFLTPIAAGQYGIISLVGKIIFFTGSLLLPFIVPIVSRNEGAGKNSQRIFVFLFVLTLFLTGSSFIALGIFGNFFVPLLFGAKSLSIIPYLPVYLLAIGLFTITRPIIQYYQAKKNYFFTLPGILLSALEIIFLIFFHNNLNQFVTMLLFASIIHFVITLVLYLLRNRLPIVASNLKDLYSLIFTPLSIGTKTAASSGCFKILIFNWRDTKHVWAGGAEVYVHELAKCWVKAGNKVTVFCGNDTKQARNETIDGVQIYRRGGFYMVYIWAFLYYMFKFRGEYDVIIDSENGIPFFTPLYAREKIFLLIHHVHQEVFLTDLKFPLSQIGKFLEGKLMPFVYRNSKIITVSESSKQAILELGFGKRSKISIASPGVDLKKFQTNYLKSTTPSLLYLGRLKPYKSIDRLIKIMKKVKRQVPGVTLTIAGEGESRGYLENLTRKLGLEEVVKFLGGVSEKAKVELFAKSWVLVHPSKIEGWGITVIEANAAGTTVIASDVPGLRDSVRNPHTGLLVTWDNQEKWIDAITKVLMDQRLRNFLEANSKQWAKEFSWDKSSTKLMKLLRD